MRPILPRDMGRIGGMGAAVAAALLVGAGASAGKAPPSSAADAALKALGAKSFKSSIVVYRSAAPLPAGTIVSESGPTRFKGRGTRTVAVKSWKLPRPAWLFWADLAPGADFSHPSRLALVDAKTGRAGAVAKLTWRPLVNGKPAVTRDFQRSRIVYSKLVLPKKTRSAAGLASTRLPTSALAPAFPKERDCMVSIGDYTDEREPSNFGDDLELFSKWATRRGLPKRTAERVAGFEDDIGDLIEKGCNDVILVVAGHGLAAPGTPNVATSPEPTVVLSERQVVKGGKAQTKITVITASDIRKIIEKYQRRARFKLIVDSCFSGRFEEALDDLQQGEDPPIRVIVTSSAADEPTIRYIEGVDRESGDGGSYFAKSITKALDDVRKTPDLWNTAKDDMAIEIKMAAELVEEKPEKYGNTAVSLELNDIGSVISAPQDITLELTISAIKARFVEAERATHYTVPTVKGQKGAEIDFKWTLTLEKVDPDKAVDTGCNNRGVLTGTAREFVWFHGNIGDQVRDDGCTHALQGKFGHQGLIFLLVTSDDGWRCTATYKGTLSSEENVALGQQATGAPDCRRP